MILEFKHPAIVKKIDEPCSIILVGKMKIPSIVSTETLPENSKEGDRITYIHEEDGLGED